MFAYDAAAATQKLFADKHRKTRRRKMKNLISVHNINFIKEITFFLWYALTTVWVLTSLVGSMFLSDKLFLRFTVSNEPCLEWLSTITVALTTLACTGGDGGGGTSSSYRGFCNKNIWCRRYCKQQQSWVIIGNYLLDLVTVPTTIIFCFVRRRRDGGARMIV